VACRTPPLTRETCDTSDAHTLTRQRVRSHHPEEYLLEEGCSLGCICCSLGAYLAQPDAWLRTSAPRQPHATARRHRPQCLLAGRASLFAMALAAGRLGESVVHNTSSGPWPEEKCRADRTAPTCFLAFIPHRGADAATWWCHARVLTCF
jgi:hypothetical protein